MKTRINNLNMNLTNQSINKDSQNMSKEVAILNNLIKKKDESIKVLNTKLENF